jgi:hypothetical protein
MAVSIALACGGKGCFADHDVGVAAAQGLVIRCILVVTNSSPDMAPIVLQNSEIAAPPISRQTTKRAAIADRCTLRLTPEVMGEFIVR